MSRTFNSLAMFESNSNSINDESIEELANKPNYDDELEAQLSDTSTTDDYTQQLASTLDGILTLLKRYEKMENWMLDDSQSHIISKSPLTPYEQDIYRSVFSNYVQALPDGRMVIINPFELAAARLLTTSISFFKPISSEPPIVAIASPVSVSNAESIFNTSASRAFSAKSAFRPLSAFTRR